MMIFWIWQERGRQVGAIALLSVISSLLWTTPAKSQMPTSFSVQSERIGAGSIGEAAYKLHVGAGAGGAAFGFEYRLPTWPTPNQVLGSPIAISDVHMSGPGEIRPSASMAVAKPRLRRKEACEREGPSPFALAYWVELPADSSALIELRGKGSFPSWPRTQFDVSFSTFEVDAPAAPRNLIKTVSLPPLGPIGVHIQMRSLGSGGTSGRPRMTPPLIGWTEPALTAAHISLRAVRVPISGRVTLSQWTEPAAVRLGGLRTDARGRFRLDPQQFRYVGRYAILARSSPRAGKAADWNCGPFF